MSCSTIKVNINGTNCSAEICDILKANTKCIKISYETSTKYVCNISNTLPKRNIVDCYEMNNHVICLNKRPELIETCNFTVDDKIKVYVYNKEILEKKPSSFELIYYNNDKVHIYVPPSIIKNDGDKSSLTNFSMVVSPNIIKEIIPSNEKCACKLLIYIYSEFYDYKHEFPFGFKIHINHIELDISPDNKSTLQDQITSLAALFNFNDDKKILNLTIKIAVDIGYNYNENLGILHSFHRIKEVIIKIIKKFTSNIHDFEEEMKDISYNLFVFDKAVAIHRSDDTFHILYKDQVILFKYLYRIPRTRIAFSTTFENVKLSEIKGNLPKLLNDKYNAIIKYYELISTQINFINSKFTPLLSDDVDDLIMMQFLNSMSGNHIDNDIRIVEKI